jgi:hypothetical protein
VPIAPGLTAFTRAPFGPYLAAQVSANRLMAALLEPYKLIPGAPISSSHRGKIHDGPFASLGHQRGKRSDVEIWPLHVCGENAVKLFFRHFMRRLERIDPSIVDENIDMAISEFDRFPSYLTCAVCASKLGGNKICSASRSANFVDCLLPALRISPPQPKYKYQAERVSLPSRD